MEGIVLFDSISEEQERCTEYVYHTTAEGYRETEAEPQPS